MPARTLEPHLVGTDEIAAELGITVNALMGRWYRKSTHIPPLIKDGRRLVMHRTAWNAWVAERNARTVAAQAAAGLEKDARDAARGT